MFASASAKHQWAVSSFVTGQMELAAGNPAVAERYFRDAYDAFHAMGEEAYFANAAALLAEAPLLQAVREWPHLLLAGKARDLGKQQTW
jgi:hypothetical protein